MKKGKKYVILLTICLGALIGCSDTKETVPEMSVPVKQDTQLETATANETLEENDQDVPYAVLEEAEAWAAEEFEYAKRVSAGNHYSDWRIESREHCYTYEDFDGMTLQVYRMNIEFLSDTPESVALMGGMTMTEDGWVVPDYPNSRYLVFQQDGETLTFLTRLFENDCQPGDSTFTHDLEHQLALNQQSQMAVPTLTFVLEGEAYEVPAMIARGNGYTFYLPDGEWYPSDFESWEDIDEEWKPLIFEAWTEWNNEEVRLWIVRFEGKAFDETEQELLNSGYAVVNDEIFRQDGELIYGVELKKAETDTWGVFYSYPVDAEEGWGAQIRAIADTFTISD